MYRNLIFLVLCTVFIKISCPVLLNLAIVVMIYCTFQVTRPVGSGHCTRWVYLACRCTMSTTTAPQAPPPSLLPGTLCKAARQTAYSHWASRRCRKGPSHQWWVTLEGPYVFERLFYLNSFFLSSWVLYCYISTVLKILKSMSKLIQLLTLV